MANRNIECIDRFACPTCKEKKGYRCRYVTGVRVGQITKNPHNERLNKLAMAEFRRLNAEWLAERDLRMGHTAERRLALVAYANQMRREHEQLRDWLRRHSRVLTQGL